MYVCMYVCIECAATCRSIDIQKFEYQFGVFLTTSSLAILGHLMEYANISHSPQIDKAQAVARKCTYCSKRFQPDGPERA